MDQSVEGNWNHEFRGFQGWVSRKAQASPSRGEEKVDINTYEHSKGRDKKIGGNQNHGHGPAKFLCSPKKKNRGNLDKCRDLEEEMTKKGAHTREGWVISLGERGPTNMEGRGRFMDEGGVVFSRVTGGKGGEKKEVEWINSKDRRPGTSD